MQRAASGLRAAVNAAPCRLDYVAGEQSFRVRWRKRWQLASPSRTPKQSGLASELANVRDMQDGDQGRFAQTQMQAYALQTQELGRLMAEVSQSMQPRG